MARSKPKINWGVLLLLWGLPIAEVVLIAEVVKKVRTPNPCTCLDERIMVIEWIKGNFSEQHPNIDPAEFDLMIEGIRARAKGCKK